jgi:hypothetical protein
MQTSCIEPDNARDFRGANHQIPAGVNPSTVFESIMVSARANAPANDDLLHGRARLCRSCGAETQSIDVCPACADAMREERAAEQARQCRIHRVRYVEDLPVSVLREMQAERGRC